VGRGEGSRAESVNGSSQLRGAFHVVLPQYPTLPICYLRCCRGAFFPTSLNDVQHAQEADHRIELVFALRSFRESLVDRCLEALVRDNRASFQSAEQMPGYRLASIGPTLAPFGFIRKLELVIDFAGICLRHDDRKPLEQII